MATFRKLPDAVLDSIAVRVGRLASTTIGPFVIHANARLEMSESMEVWLLSGSRLLDPTDRLSDLAEPTGRWHHQIRLLQSSGDTQADSIDVVGYARSSPLGPDPEDWSVREMTKSGLAKSIDRAIAWIDLNDNSDDITRILLVPDFYTIAFWMTDFVRHYERVVLIDTPEEYTDYHLDRFYSASEFLRILRNIVPPMGII